MDRLLYQPNWIEVKRRWTAFWEGERLDRPCMLVTAPAKSIPLPEPPSDPRLVWTDPEYLIACDEARHASTHYLGESVPNARALLMAWCAAYGAPIEYRPDTIWIGPRFTSWEEAPDFEQDWNDEGWRALKDTLPAVVEHARGRYLVGMPPMLPPNDLLSLLRGPLAFVVDLIECPDRVKETLRIMRVQFLRMYWELADLLDTETQGYGNWWPFWSPYPFYAPQSDVSCMLSPELFERFIVSELEELCAAWTNVFYHLDGVGALHHLDRLLSMEGIDGIQWVPGSGQPSGWRAWQDLYVKIAAAGKRVWFGCTPSEVQDVIRRIPPEWLLLSVHTSSREEGEDLLKAALKWTAEYWPPGS